MIYGKRGHAEVNGLVAQTNDEALIIEQEEDLKSIDFLINRSKVNRSVGNFRIIVAHKYSVLKSCGCKNTSVAFAVNIWQNINKLSVQTYGQRSAVE